MAEARLEENIPKWIYHFENQAKEGISRRSSFNNRIIVVQKEKTSVLRAKDSKSDEKIPDIVSPVQQIVEQAEEEIRREKEEEEIDIKYKGRKPTIKRKRTVKGKISTKKFKDIFSTK